MHISITGPWWINWVSVALDKPLSRPLFMLDCFLLGFFCVDGNEKYSGGIPTWISNDIHHYVWDEITYPFPNFNSTTVEVWEWISNFIPHFTGCVIAGIKINSLWPSDTIWQHKSGWTLAQVMACCLTAPSHYLNQSWLIISKVQWHSSESNFTRDTSVICHWNKLENYLSKILFKSPRGQWVNPCN